MSAYVIFDIKVTDPERFAMPRSHVGCRMRRLDRGTAR